MTKDNSSKIIYTYIDTNNEFDQLLSYFSKNKVELIAVDFECESNLHVYGERLCLIQFYDNSSFFLIDPYAIDVKKLKKLFENNKIVKIFYDAIFDSLILFKQYQINIQAVYDLKLLVDTLDFDSKGLDAVTYQLLGIKITDKKRYQFYDWTKRPINEPAKQYALHDVKHLFELKSLLIERIERENRYEALINKIRGPLKTPSEIYT